ncbi:MAG: nucleotidyltransferase domain-containing protein [Atribacterota bacterium]|nr:nucleotidyltransferase domain-containing protein [Atribacterota bacterium]
MPSFVREESSGSVKVFWLEREKLFEAIQREIQRLVSENRCIEKVVLFGSLAQGRAIPGSDVDLLFVLAESDKPFLERVEEWRSKVHLDFPVDVFPYTIVELDIPFVQGVLRTGVVLFQRGRDEGA